MQMQRVSKWSSSLVRFRLAYCLLRRQSSLSTGNNNDRDKDNEWNDAWETAWLPDDFSGNNSTGAPAPAPWESDSVNLGPVDDDPDAKAFVEDMNANWDHRRTNNHKHKHPHPHPHNNNNDNDNNTDTTSNDKAGGFYSMKNVKKDYRLKKQRIHASLWSQQIDLLHEAKLRDADADDDIDKLLDSCSQIFDDDDDDAHLNKPNPKTKPDGWETTSSSTSQDDVWDMSQREEDILLQEFERRLAFSKFQIASFIKTHIFSRRRPIDGWKYMIEVIGPNARKGKGSVSRLPTLADPATQPFTEDRRPVTGGRLSSRKPR